MENKITIFWFRRDLRLEDNTALHFALNSGNKVLPIFIFDEDILESLPESDARITFIYNSLNEIDIQLKSFGSSLLVLKGKPLNIWKKLCTEYRVEKVYFNKDYEPYAIKRDNQISAFLNTQNIQTHSYKDQVIFEEHDILKADKSPYTVYTPYKNQWLKHFNLKVHTATFDCLNLKSQFLKFQCTFPTLEKLGFKESDIKVKPYQLNDLKAYDELRDYPALDKTSNLSPYLRFGLVSIRRIVDHAHQTNAVFLSELIWREFFMQILFHFPKVVTQNFKSKYDNVIWRHDESDFKKWCAGETGYPLVDAGMRELNKTGYMHNRVRMITAGFLCKHLLIDWRWGEAYFAEKLLDFELASNNGNWQWAAGTGCDAAPYFRIFNPTTQIKKFDKDLEYIKRWVPEFQELDYPKPIIEHKAARERCLHVYRQALS
ncbi:deoxyribodipyrimidine photo-lyase [Tamlana sp. s12]|uniref:cryptochrome/photolyase family protein n=1 Tax=Tamlana sp. s12 TaxID=1630406 RepID=UPI0008006B9C|nr:deoxyribodipyrimidine photo-lyase [Tamlana sp. s12]OBQ52816.1 deoxyribodipyrimidine photolyase [Tamlana sp. s12]QQY81161.1 deoxyribodipyrimidine photo-lyase [Tamlana sp. s12]